MKMTQEDVQHMVGLVAKDRDGLYIKEDFINLFTT